MSASAGMGGGESWVAPASFDDAPVDYIHIMPDRYTVAFAADADIHRFAEDVAGETDRYAVIPGEDWDDAGPQQMRETDGVPLQQGDDAVYLRQGGIDDRYTRAYYAADDRHDAEIAVTVPAEYGQHQVAPLHDALAPFYDDAAALEAVTAVEDVLERCDAGDMETVEL